MSEAINAEEAFVGTVEPTGADRLDEARLAEWMAANVAGFAGPLQLTKFKGGQSNPTYKITAPSGNYVLRRKPFGPLLPSAHATRWCSRRTSGPSPRPEQKVESRKQKWFRASSRRLLPTAAARWKRSNAATSNPCSHRRTG